MPERPRVDHPVDRPELYGLRGLEVTGTNGRSLDRFYRRPSSHIDGSLVRSVIRSISSFERNPRSVLDEGGACFAALPPGRWSWPKPEIEPRLHESTTTVAGPQPAGDGIVGGYTRGVTPVPIPNTAVKPAGPMILRQRESRSPPALNTKAPDPSPDRGLSLFPVVVLTQVIEMSALKPRHSLARL